MHDRSFIKILTISLFAFLGMLMGVMLVPAMEGSGSVYVWGIAGIIGIIILIAAAKSYMQKGQRDMVSSGQGQEGSKVGFVVDTFHDLVDRLKEKERELEKLKSHAEERAGRVEAYNENVLQSVPSGVISIDNEGTIKSINQAAERILCADINVIGNKFNDVFREPLTAILRGDRTVSRAEHPYITDSGKHLWLGITTSLLTNSAHEKIGLILVFTDLTDIRALEAQVELKERLSQLGEMSAGISHELRNSMSVISGYAKLLSRKVESSAQGTVDAIQEEIQIMNQIISELLAFAKPSVLHREQLIVNELLKEAVETAAAGSSAIDVSIHAEGPVSVNADRVLLRQALTNLLFNAVEAMPEGGTIDIELSAVHGKAEIYIRDRGQGIPEDLKQKIFLPFFTTKEKGTGFGLALVQKIIISHSGSIDVDSREGEGAVFRVVLPAEG
jgi:PAS domain S-box-containing protein